ncbi:hypothetical protein LAZ67_9000494 [Cordylochernes scorpioides]|uniref:Reverse transcriptase domain-containing protein n=1 Tax=Cordylochernes scorpioides TaxID=51811 RepID=A0ABY6KSJ3_9ARAC|nr:hypothetical protein LAZ67_9000494 [Cordylochernes scorpioides]
MKFRNIQKPDPIKIVSGVEAAVSRLNNQEKNIIRHHVTNLLSEPVILPQFNPHENRLIKDLKNRKEIIITHSDKGGHTVILDKSDYHQKMRIILEDPTTFKHISGEEKTRIYSSYKNELRKMNRENKITNEELKDFLSNMQTDAHIYGLPKIHKPDVPLRPIVAFYHSPTAPLSKFISAFLKPIIQQQSFQYSIFNTSIFIEEVLKCQAPSDKIMVSFDVKSLYPSLPHQLILNSTEEYLKENPIDPITVKKISKLIALCLETNIITYNHKTYKQTKGSPMGSSLSTSVAEIVMRRIDKAKHSTTPLVRLSKEGNSYSVIVKKLKAEGLDVGKATICRVVNGIGKKREAESNGQKFQVDRPRPVRTPATVSKVKRLATTENPPSQRQLSRMCGTSLKTINNIIHKDLELDTRRKGKVHKLTPFHMKNRATNARKLYEEHLAGSRSEYTATLDEAWMYVTYNLAMYSLLPWFFLVAYILFILSVYGEECMSIQMVRRWRSWFLEGRQNVHDDERSGSPVTATDNAAVAAVRNVVEARSPSHH